MICEKCQHVNDFITSGQDFGERFEFGDFRDIEARAHRCHTCEQILRRLVEHFSTLGYNLIEGPAYISLRLQGPEISLHCSVLSKGFSKVEYVTFCDEDPKGIGLRIDPNWINCYQVRHWLERCDKHHAGRCYTLPDRQNYSSLQSILLIDTEQQYLVAMPSDTRYFALSYMWGKSANNTETTMGNFSCFQQPGAFDIEENTIILPETIKDAIRFVRVLGGRYLWVDRFCIIQDDMPSKQHYISRMDSVYSNAYCTIVAAEGDAAHGIRGVGLGSSPRYYNQKTLDFPGFQLLEHQKEYAWKHSQYNTRGWTYQELCLSRRTIIYHRHSVQWVCRTSLWNEDTFDPSQAPAFNEAFALDFEAFPNMFQWGALVSTFNRRDLSNPGDAYAAFAGVERILESSFPGGFCYGIPEFFFDAALLWQPLGAAERRLARDSRFGHHLLPSWSWLGWKGALERTSLIPGYNDYIHRASIYPEVHRNIDWIVEPLVDWVQVNPPSGNQRSIRNHYRIWRASSKGQTALPEGWDYVEDDEGGYYTNESEPQVIFHYPSPSVAELRPRTDVFWPPYLQFRSSRAFFTFGQKIDLMGAFKEYCQDTTAAFIMDRKGGYGGILRLNLPRPDSAPVGQTLELVAISKGRASFDLSEDPPPMIWVEELFLDCISKRNGIYEFYNVLWIKWEGSFITREALGRVEKSVWEQQDLEEMNFLLR